jgi:fatty-acyl-CoA synthase
LKGIQTKKLVDCGVPLPGHKIVVRNEHGQTLPDRKCGTIYVQGPSVMCGYFGDPVATAKVLSADGWLNTGDIGYLHDGNLVITGREKDMIIINGRNFWPQDLEFYAEQQPEIRPGDASAVSVPATDGSEMAVMVVQYRETNESKRSEMSNRLARIIREEVGINCTIELVPAHTLPRTSSGKLSRAGTQRDYLRRLEEQKKLSVKPLFEEQNVNEDNSDLRLAAVGQRYAH